MSYDVIAKLVADAKHVVVLQADNPDADSLGASLALEQLLGEQDVSVTLYCGVGVPNYLRHMDGWDRVVDELPNDFDASIVVDAAADDLLSTVAADANYTRLKTQPSLMIDHHAVSDSTIEFVDDQIIDESVSSTGELVYNIAKELGWQLDETSGQHIMHAILGDTQGLANSMTSAQTYRVMAALVELGVDRPALEEKRRQISKMHPSIMRYKGTLLGRAELALDGKLALLHIPQDEINTYSPLYNPSALVTPDLLQTEGVAIVVVVKSYDDGRITAGIRANMHAPIAAKLAEHFGGGGHDQAAGFKLTDGQNPADVMEQIRVEVSRLLEAQ